MGNTPQLFREELLFLSNMFPVRFYLPEIEEWVESSEHGFMALKTNDPDERVNVLAVETPQKVKQFAAKPKNVTLRGDWDTFRLEAMAAVVRAKFSVPELRDKLVETADAVLVENNRWHDQFWGNCYCDLHETVVGQNNLGKTLMAERARIINEMEH